MQGELAVAPSVAHTFNRPEVLQAFLNSYWLRPENAMWMTLRSEALSLCHIDHPSLDLSCGDGVFSFLHAGGRFDESFDVFASVGALDRVRDEHADMFDHVGDDYRPPVVHAPSDTIDAGTDLKPTSLEKARRLSFYGRLVEHDSNRPLPFEASSFQTVYCNSAYWVMQIDAFLAELHRITRPGGRIVLHIKLDSMREYTLERHRRQLGASFLEIIGRGRIASWPSLASRAVWERRFSAAGLNIEAEIPFATGTHSHVWDVGLRPIAHLLVKMTKELSPSKRVSIKREWVRSVGELLAPLADPALDLTDEPREAAEVQYVLSPRVAGA